MRINLPRIISINNGTVFWIKISRSCKLIITPGFYCLHAFCPGVFLMLLHLQSGGLCFKHIFRDEDRGYQSY